MLCNVFFLAYCTGFNPSTMLSRNGKNLLSCLFPSHAYQGRCTVFHLSLTFTRPGEIWASSKGWPFTAGWRTLELALGHVFFFLFWSMSHGDCKFLEGSSALFGFSSCAVLGMVLSLTDPHCQQGHGIVQRLCMCTFCPVPFAFLLNQRWSCSPPCLLFLLQKPEWEET